LVRHGRTEANAANLLQGHIDNHLDDIGRAQAAVLGNALEAIASVDRVIASPLVRAQQTAEAIARSCGRGLSVETDRRWIELDYGDFDGQPVTAVGADTWRQWRNDVHFRPPGGESMAELDARVQSALVDLAQGPNGLHIVVVSHVSPIKAAIAWALGVGIEISWRTSLDRASMSTIRLDVERPALKSFNVTVHHEK
jgi:probable phosphoglycerate mutase